MEQRMVTIYCLIDEYLKGVLYSKSEHIEQAIFKGGTALSKAYRVIERFSEDIDLAVISTDMTSNQTKKLIKRIEKRIIDANFEEIVDHIQVSKGS